MQWVPKYMSLIQSIHLFSCWLIASVSFGKARQSIGMVLRPRCVLLIAHLLAQMSWKPIHTGLLLRETRSLSPQKRNNLQPVPTSHKVCAAYLRRQDTVVTPGGVFLSIEVEVQLLQATLHRLLLLKSSDLARLPAALHRLPPNNLLQHLWINLQSLDGHLPTLIPTM